MRRKPLPVSLPLRYLAHMSAQFHRDLRKLVDDPNGPGSKRERKRKIAVACGVRVRHIEKWVAGISKPPRRFQQRVLDAARAALASG